METGGDFQSARRAAGRQEVLLTWWRQMDTSSATRGTLRALGLCAVLLLLVASATISVAVMVWHSEAARQLKGCQGRTTNESAALVGRLVELERAQAEHRQQVARLAQREKELQQRLSQAQEDQKRLEATLMGCWENMTHLDASLLALRNETLALHAEGAAMDRQNGALLAEVAGWKAQVAALRGRLEEAEQARAAAKAEEGRCQARQEALRDSLRSYQAEIASLQRRLGARSSTHRRCPLFRKA